MSDNEFIFSTKGLDALIKAFKEPGYVRIGVMSDKDVRSSEKQKSGSTNSEIGAVHEFGAPAKGIPPRSFLRMPVTEHLEKELQKSGAFDDKTLKDVIKEKMITPWLKKVAIAAEGVVADAFATGGFGSWKKWKNPNQKSNANMVLVDTQQLRNSIGTEVKEKK